VHELVKLIDEGEIVARVEELGREISDDFRGDQIVLVTPLKGGVFFLADLARWISVPVELDFVSAHSYEGDRSSGKVRLEKGPSLGLKGKKVLLVEDIIDTGRTCSFLMELIAGQEPDVLKVCSLLDKPARREVQVVVDYVGFTIEDRFVVGYGLDYMEQYRNLRDIFYIELERDPTS
jgi:hypoxanthine phosphoribosyltransferase